ncbi:hypothetical protein vseg_005136 [Gypsophila vaccaria]
MHDHRQTTDHHKHLSLLPNDPQTQHRRIKSSESLSFRYFYDDTAIEDFIPETSTTTPLASPAFLSPDSSPITLAPTPGSRWSFSSSPCTPINHLPPPLLHHCTFSLRHHDGNIQSFAVARGLLFTSSNTPSIRAWQLSSSCCEMGYVRASSGDIRAMLAHGHMLFTSHKDLKIRVWNISPYSSHIDRLVHLRKLSTFPKSKPLRILLSKPSSKQHKDTISCMTYNLIEGILYTGSYDKTVKAWTLSNRKCIDTFVAHSDNINAMVINDNGYLFTCSSDGSIKMWTKVRGDTTCHTLTTVLHFRPFPVYALALSPASVTENSLLYSGASDGCIYFWDPHIPSEYTRQGFIQGHQLGVLCLAVLEDKVISGSTDTTIKIWRRKREYGVVSHECVGVLEGHRGPVKCVVACLEEDSFVRGFLVFSSGLDCTFKAWKVKVLPETKGEPRLDYGFDDGD